MATKIKLINPKILLTLGFYTEYQSKILNEYKYDNQIVNISAFYETSNTNSFLRIEEFSFDFKTNNQKTGKLYMLNGTLAHYSTIDGFEKLANLTEIINKAKANHSHFILFIYGDLKSFIFRSRFFLLSTCVDYKIKKIQPEISEENNKTDINSYLKSNEANVIMKSWYSSPNNNYVLIHDISSITNTIPIFIKNSLYEYFPTNNNIKYVVLQKETNSFLQLELENIKVNDIDVEKIQKIEITKTDLKQMFDPETVAENAVNLNINLMKWRMCPFLDTDIIRTSKYLLIGSGTLGCHVSRCLMGWGAKNITFVDNGKVSYSNPVRQSLYTFEDSKNVENNYKSILAAKKLKEIYPKVNSEGYLLHIPLPGRTLVDEAAKKSYLDNLTLLEKLIKENDIIFLLTDSRESRWYPTLIAKAYNKRVITAAIGFDSYLVMRHGTKEDQLGCYFCTDIVTPTDTSGSRTLDQQCTISRPGVSMICSGLACELAMSCMNEALNEEEKLDGIPHQIRGNLLNYSMQQLRHCYNKNCVACCDMMVDKYLNSREEFIMNVMNDPFYIEKISGVADLIKEASKIEDINDEDDF